VEEAQMPKPSQSAVLAEAEFFKALADPNRLALVERLADCCASITVTDASSCCEVDLSVVSRHLKILLSSGIVQAERRGREVRYTLDQEGTAGRLRRIADRIEETCRCRSANGERDGDDGRLR
jgi:DNA-binding transcriptional ArsR family regulator